MAVACTQGMLLRLDRDHRSVGLPDTVLGLPSQQAALVLGIEAAVCRKRLSRARQALAPFADTVCGVVDADAACRCDQQLRGFAVAGMGNRSTELTSDEPFVMPALEPGCRRDLAAALEAMPASRLIGLQVLGFAASGISVIALPVHGALSFDGRVVQAGIVGMLADYAGVSAAACTLAAGWMASTTGYEVHNLAPAVGTRLVAVGRAVRVGRSHAVSRAEVWAFAAEKEGGENAGKASLVAWATTTCRPFEFKPAGA